jgi:arylsulfatase A-like enzyme
MVERWWLLFRGLAVVTILFVAPVVVLRELHPLSYLLSVRGAIAELALEITVIVLLEALLTALLALILSAGHALRFWSDRADARCAGFLSFAGVTVCGLVLLGPLDTMISRVVNTALHAILIFAATVILALFGWDRGFSLFNRLSQSAQVVLAVCPLLLILMLTGGFGWRSFDPMPRALPLPVPAPARPNVLLISFDALTAQDMSLYGYRLPTTPQFERLAGRSYNFVNFFSASDFTTPGAASLLTGEYPLTNRVFQLDGHIPHRLRKENVVWVLRQHGYTTAAIVTNPAAHPLTLRVADSFSSLPRPPISSWFFPGTFLLQLRDGLLVDPANDFMITALMGLSYVFSGLNEVHFVDPQAVFAAAQDFIQGVRTPYFLWIHIFPPHASYLPSARFRGRFLSGSAFTTETQYFWQKPGPYDPSTTQHQVDLMRLRYDESIAECDSALGKFLDWMATGRSAANTILVVTADHGENFSDGWWTHESPDLHYAETHIPLLISLPGQSRGYIETEDGDHTDVAPTLLALLGIRPPSWMDGHPLIDAAGRPAPPQPAYSMYLAQSSPFDRPATGTIAANSGSYRLVWYFPSQRVAFFHIAGDPGEAHRISTLNAPNVAMGLLLDIWRRFGAAIGRGLPVSRQ